MSTTVRVELGARSYDIHIGRDLDPGHAIDDAEGRSVMVVSDSNVAPLHGDACVRRLEARGMSVTRAIVPAGETSKSLGRVSELYDQAFAAGLDRKSIVVALGGGVVGDLAGFFAATFLRGVRLVQVPTSLLAMVDSSVGGKTGVNVPQGKNLVGAFYQPVEVDIDLATLETLPNPEYTSGLAEVVKYGIIHDAALLARIEQHTHGLLARDPAVLSAIIADCCRIKAEVVGADEHESGLRAILNFGHTLGHAIENVWGYGACLHGEAVAIGMVYALELSVREAGLPPADAERTIRLIEALGLPTHDARLTEPGAWPSIRAAMATDKKNVGRVPRFVLAEALGRATFGWSVDGDVLRETFKGFAV